MMAHAHGFCRIEDLSTDEFLRAWYGDAAVDRMNAYFESDEFKAEAESMFKKWKNPNPCSTGEVCRPTFWGPGIVDMLKEK